MYSICAKLLSLLLIVAYLYKKTKDRICLWFLGFALLYTVGYVGFQTLPPDIRSLPIVGWAGFFVVFCIPLLIFLGLIGVEIEKRESGKAEEKKKDHRAIFMLSKDNVIFWIIIVLINLIAFLLE